MKNIDEVFEYLDKINDTNNLRYLDCKMNSYINEDWYKEILKEVLKEKPKRVIDIGSNLNQYGYLFVNKDIEYIGIDKNTTLPTSDGIMQPIITEKIKFIQADYRKIKEFFKNDIIISCLCVGYMIETKEVECKKLIIDSVNEEGKPTIKIYKKPKRV